MGSESRTSLEALAMLGVDYRSVQLPVLEKPWHLMLDPEDNSKKQDLDYHGRNCNKMEEIKGLEEQVYCLDLEGRMKDPDYIKKRLRKWVKAVASYVRFLDALPSQYLHTDIT